MTPARRKALLCLLLLLGSCSAPAPPDHVTIILGFDGMDPQLAAQWMDAGQLPNLARLRDEGLFAPLATSNPPQSPVAWSAFATGLPTGQHGIYDFLRRDPSSHTAAYAISQSLPPATLDLFGLKIPVSAGSLVNRRQGEPFWTVAEASGQRTTTLRVPVTYPPDEVHRMLAGMGVPDLLGTQGTYTIYSASPRLAAGANGRVIRMRPGRGGRVETRFEGPANPLDPATALAVPLVVEASGQDVRVTLDDHAVVLTEGQWSDWIELRFRFFGVLKVTGLVRVHVNRGYPDPELYVSPIQINPHDPVVPLSSPPSYVTELADAIGNFHTIGMPEETWSLTEGDLTDSAWLAMVRTTLAEREAMFYDTLARRDSDIVTTVFVQTDRVSHMFYRGLDSGHALHGAADEAARGAIAWIYREADRIVGETLQRMQPNDRLIIISDHGFAPFRHAVHLNRALADAGLLTLKPGQDVSEQGFAQVDWARTQAYALGLNGVYINLAEREAMGSVAADQFEAVRERVRNALLALTDGEQPLVRRVFDGSEIYPENANGDAPDLVVGYHRGYRASWQTSLGGVPAALLDVNRSKWSGDHCIDPELVPGVLFMSRPTASPPSSIEEVGRWVLANPL